MGDKQLDPHYFDGVNQKECKEQLERILNDEITVAVENRESTEDVSASPFEDPVPEKPDGMN